LSKRERKWEREGGLENRKKKGEDQPQMIGSMSYALDSPFVGRCGGNVRCMCGPSYVRFPLQQEKERKGRRSANFSSPPFNSFSTPAPRPSPPPSPEGSGRGPVVGLTVYVGVVGRAYSLVLSIKFWGGVPGAEK